MDTVSQFLVSIKNAKLAGKDKVDIPSSKVRQSIAAILKEKGWIKDYRIADDGKQGLMRIYLTLESGFRCEFKRISRPGRRVYTGYEKLLSVRSGKGFAIISTNKGIVTDDVARSQKIGGELMCKVW
jgi:small subunit ribosomal protein S8